MPRPAPSSFDLHMMGIALRMARRGLGTTAPNPAVGAVIADEATGEIVARGWTMPGGRPHAEPVAIAAAGERARGKTMYVTLEPCSHHGKTPPCADAILDAGITRVVAALEDPDPRVSGRGLDRLRAAGVSVMRGVRAEEAHWLTRGHIVRVTERRPFTQLKVALDAAGEVPRGGGGAPRFVTGPEARALGHLMRAEADAIMVGAGTVRDDDPDLTCRLPGLAGRSPLRVVLARDPAGFETSRLAASARTVPVQLFTSTDALALRQPAIAALQGLGVRADAVREVNGQLWLPTVLEQLAAQGITRLLVEGGPHLWQAFVRAGLYDEIVLFRAGGASHPAPAEAAARAALIRAIGPVDATLVMRRGIGGDDMLLFRRHPARPSR